MEFMMNPTSVQRPISKALSAVLATSLSLSTMLYAAPTQIANGPLANAASLAKPNLMFILDVSGSMASRGTPDYTMNESLCRGSGTGFVVCEDYYPPWYNYDFNYQYYDPRIRYEPAVNYDGTSRTSYTNPNSVPIDAFNVVSTGSSNLASNYFDNAWCIDAGDSPTDTARCKRNGVGGAGGYQYPQAPFVNRVNATSGPYYYNIIPTEYCRANTDPPLTQCIDATAPTTVAGVSYSVPAKIRWCSDTALTNCQDLQTPTFQYSNLARGRGASATITVANDSDNVTVSAVTINGVNAIATTTASSSTRNTIASRIRDAINNHVSNPDYVATSSGNVVTITASKVGTDANGLTISLTRTGTRNLTTTAFANGRNPPNMQRVDIVPAVTSYPKGASRTDCAGATCTYTEEVTNFNNWYAYYSTRLNMTKTAAGRAFASIDESYRVGFITIFETSNMPASRFLAVNDYTGGATGQKAQWFTKLYAQTLSGSTPLRTALSRVGRYYANKTDGINTGMTASPIQLSCQQNFAILSTDGYWNQGPGQSVSGGSIGNQDSSLGTGANQVPRPLYDGSLSGASDTLADVAAYYYKTDLRPDLDNNVPVTPKDTATHQHMTTFTIGLGVSGLLRFINNYETATTGDFQKLKLGTINWPVPSENDPTAVDDLWHAAVNGRGQYFSARNPQDVVDGLYTALSSINIRIGAGAAAATSNLQPVSGDDSAFTAEYTTVDWTGDLKAKQIDLNNGQLLPTVLWSAQSLLESKAFATRSIFTSTTNTGTYPRKLKPFTFSDLTATEQAYFNPNQVGQYGAWSVGQRAQATATNLIDFLRGDKTYYDTGATPALDTDLYRARKKVFGDIVNAQPAYMKSSPLTYNDPGHAAFVACTKGEGSATSCPSGLAAGSPRIGTVYAGANDGMLHAFNTDSGSGQGQERWAFIPSVVLPKMYKLANTNYVHDYYVDGSPVLADICVASNCTASSVDASSWRTILVAGLNGGGRGFYALDVTNPTDSGVRLLWEFKVRIGATCAATLGAAVGASDDCDVGLSYTQPVVTKRKSDGKWVVLVTSGYNNANPGDGKGYLFVLDAATGTILNKVPLPASAGGSAGTAAPATCDPATLLPVFPYCNADPVGLGKLNVFIESNEGDNTALSAFAGDLKGRLWRFDLTSATNAYPQGFLVANLLDGASKPQPITTKPEVGKVRAGTPEPSTPAVFVGTGKYLGNDDPATTQTQTIYGMRADLTTTIANARSSFVARTIGVDVVGATQTTRKLTSVGPDIDWAVNNGWYIDLPVSGERVSVDPGLSVGTLVVASNVPASSSCDAGGYGYFNTIDYQTGRQIGPVGSAFSVKVPGALVVGVSTIKLPGNKLVSIITRSDNIQITLDVPVSPPSFGGRRVSWREILAD
jgi:type IV pilus assembly protein PilY1